MRILKENWTSLNWLCGSPSSHWFVSFWERNKRENSSEIIQRLTKYGMLEFRMSLSVHFLDSDLSLFSDARWAVVDEHVERCNQDVAKRDEDGVVLWWAITAGLSLRKTKPPTKLETIKFWFLNNSFSYGIWMREKFGQKLIEIN